MTHEQRMKQLLMTVSLAVALTGQVVAMVMVRS